MKPYDTVLFDLDGTLLNTLLGLTSALTHVFLAHHFPAPTPETVRYGLGYGYIGLMERTLPEESPALHAQLAQEFNVHIVSSLRTRMTASSTSLPISRTTP